jgi:hypothetical protein
MLKQSPPGAKQVLPQLIRAAAGLRVSKDGDLSHCNTNAGELEFEGKYQDALANINQVTDIKLRVNCERWWI